MSRRTRILGSGLALVLIVGAALFAISALRGGPTLADAAEKVTGENVQLKFQMTMSAEGQTIKMTGNASARGDGKGSKAEFQIKLDHSLTGGIEFDHGQRALAQALITFAAELGATVVAEGVETRQQVEALTELGVRYGQGYHLGRPEPLPLVPTRPAANRGVATAPNERKDR